MIVVHMNNSREFWCYVFVVLRISVWWPSARGPEHWETESRRRIRDRASSASGEERDCSCSSQHQETSRWDWINLPLVLWLSSLKSTEQKLHVDSIQTFCTIWILNVRVFFLINWSFWESPIFSLLWLWLPLMMSCNLFILWTRAEQLI